MRKDAKLNSGETLERMRSQLRLARGRPDFKLRLISSFAMLAVVAAGVGFYSVRKTDELLRIGLNDHLHCAVAGTYPRQTRKGEMSDGLGDRFAPMLQPVVDAADGGVALSAHRCDIQGRAYIHIVLRRDQTLISVILTRRGEREVFPRALAAHVVDAAGIALHEGRRDGYSVACFECGGYLGYIVSALPGEKNDELARRIAPVIARFTND
jgi:hypothetical protein